MKKKEYIIPAIEIVHVEVAPLMEASITSVGGDAGIEISTDEAPGTADSRFFDIFGN
ncbi:MAG: hypothetical protein IJ559_04965 [Prevotella sp.]|nr:hypothetical protein [Prevotella sp.]